MKYNKTESTKRKFKIYKTHTISTKILILKKLFTHYILTSNTFCVVVLWS